MSCSARAVSPSGPLPRFMPKPVSSEKTMSGSIARRESSAAKSSTVKKLTSSAARLACASTLPAEASVHGSGTGGQMCMNTSMTAAAISPVTMKTASVVPMILPARFGLFMQAMEPASEQNTSGTTMQNIRLMKIVPSGARQTAPGQNAPRAQPSTMLSSIAPRKP